MIARERKRNIKKAKRMLEVSRLFPHEKRTSKNLHRRFKKVTKVVEKFIGFKPDRRTERFDISSHLNKHIEKFNIQNSFFEKFRITFDEDNNIVVIPGVAPEKNRYISKEEITKIEKKINQRRFKL